MAESFDKSGIIEFFLVEAGEHIQNLNKGLLSLEKDPTDGKTIDELFRAAHTLKGSAAMMGYQGISDVAHRAEDMLSQFRADAAPIRKETLQFLFNSVDAITIMVGGVASNQPEDLLLVEGVARSYKDVINLFKKKESPASTAPQKNQRDGLSEAREKSIGTAVPVSTGKESPVPKPAAAQVPLKKDDRDEAWERTFEVGPASRATAPQKEPPSIGQAEPGINRAAAHTPAVADADEAGKTAFAVQRRISRRAEDAPELEKQFIRVHIERLNNLMNLVGEMVVNRNRLARQVDLIKSLREELALCQARLLHEVKQFEEKFEYTMSFETPARHQGVIAQRHDFLELEFDRYDDFNLLSRKLTEITNDTNEIMLELAGFFDAFEFDSARSSMITTNLQYEITMARMVEMDKLYQMYPRPVRDLAQAENKQVNLEVKGGETKIDKTIFELISDPLMHMIRNAISHGIETVDQRTKAGKDPAGLLLLNARHEGNSIVIEIQDDGRGMDPVVLRKTAVDKGFITSSEARSLSDTDALNLIFRPGFSTAATVGKVSGRGVGMDVVFTQLCKIHGRIEIKTEKGAGTRFVIRLPLTLVIAQALIVKCQDQEMAVPMALVEETTRFSYKEIQRAAGGEMVNLRGASIRLHRLNDVLNIGQFPQRDEAYRHPTLILGMADRRLALMVEDIIGREEIVVKSLGDFLKGIKLFSGAAISGEGNVRLILNVSSLFGDDNAMTSRAGFAASHETPAGEAAGSKSRILVVDDSISIRKHLQWFLGRSGFDVEVAPDGAEALTLMARSKFDAIIMDLEMPVMHGYDLMAEMKMNPLLTNIPVIVLTSRAGEKHRLKAAEMGVHDYLVKPFEDQEMIGALHKLTSGAALAGRA